MAREVAELLREALDLPAEARATLADSLLESLDDQHDLDAEERWREEIALRLKEIDSGSSELIGWEAAKVRLRTRLNE
jgi:putative addiction module component (TIGR02574 family)